MRSATESKATGSPFGLDSCEKIVFDLRNADRNLLEFELFLQKIK